MSSHLLSEYVSKNFYYSYINQKSRTYCIRRDQQGIIIENSIVETNFEQAQKYVVKVDQNVKSRMKQGLVALNLSVEQVIEWINQIDPFYQNFVVEPMIENVLSESYLLLRNFNTCIEITYIVQGGIDVSSEDISNTTGYIVEFNETLTPEKCQKIVPVCNPHFAIISEFITNILGFYRHYHLTFLEINPVAIQNSVCVPLDILARYDPCSLYLYEPLDRALTESQYEINTSLSKTNKINRTVEETHILNLAKRTGASLKFTLLNPNSRVWFLLFGGGASVCYFDKWLAMILNETGSLDPSLSPAGYGELSGNPDRGSVYEYVNQILTLMSKSMATGPFYFVIGGGIANFTMVDITFQGISDAVSKHADMLTKLNVEIYARRGGPGYETGLEILKNTCHMHGLVNHLYGPEIMLTEILDMVYQKETDKCWNSETYRVVDCDIDIVSDTDMKIYKLDFLKDTTTCFIYGLQTSVAQNMLDFDVHAGRTTPSVVAFVDPTRKSVSNVPLFWGTSSILVPVYPSIDMVVSAHPDVTVMINFASYRAAYLSTRSALLNPFIHMITVLAEGLAENETKDLCYLAKQTGKILLGPSTIGAVFPGQIRLGNAGGKIDHLLQTGLHRRVDPGCGVPGIGIVTRSGGLLNELCHMISQNGLQIAAAIAIGGDRFVGTSFVDVVSWYGSDKCDNVGAIIMLGEIGGTQEIEVANLVKQGLIKKPVVGLCLGTSADFFTDNSQFVQFGHAGADASYPREKASFKNSYMASHGITVPTSWEDISVKISEIFRDMPAPPPRQMEKHRKIPIAFTEAKAQGLVRKHPNFYSSISDERKNLSYSSIPVSEINCLGKAIGLLWFKKVLPDYLTHYIELILIVCADHGPCVSGAQNTIITTRAGKDLVSSLCTGLLTIGPKFGGAIGEAARMFYHGAKNSTPVNEFLRKYRIISGIGHKHYDVYNPDPRVELLATYISEHLRTTNTIEYARSIETATTLKKPNLILNVDGFIAASMIDALIDTGFTETEIDNIIDGDVLNSFFVLSRTIGLIGHHIDQKRLRQDLYRCPEYDVEYLE